MSKPKDASQALDALKSAVADLEGFITEGTEEKGGEEKVTTGRRRRRAAKAKEKPEEPEGPTLKEVRAKALEVIEEFGNEEAEAILKKFGAARISELESKDYKAFVDECQEALDEPEDD